MATHSSVLAWRIPGTGEPGGLPSMGSHRVGHDWSDLAAAAAALEVQDSSEFTYVSSFINKEIDSEPRPVQLEINLSGICDRWKKILK